MLNIDKYHSWNLLLRTLDYRRIYKLFLVNLYVPFLLRINVEQVTILFHTSSFYFEVAVFTSKVNAGS